MHLLLVPADETLFRCCCDSLCAAFLGGGGIMDDMEGVLTAQLLLLLVMLLMTGLAWSVSRLDGAWNDDISSCMIRLIAIAPCIHPSVKTQVKYKAK